MRQPSAMPWPSSAVNCGPRRLSPPPRITERYRNSQPTCSTAFCSSPADRPDLQSQAKGDIQPLKARGISENLASTAKILARVATASDALQIKRARDLSLKKESGLENGPQ